MNRKTIINSIIRALNDVIKKKNAELCRHNLHDQQTPLHGFDMFFKLANISDRKLKKIAAECGI